jgi:recombination protein RecT
MSQTLVQRQKSIIETIDRMKGQISAALPKHISADRMARIAMTAIRTNPKLAMCSEGSLLGALLHASQLGLEPNTPLGECYLIPYKDECTFQLGYKGLLTLAYRSGQYKRIFAEHVYPSDVFKSTAGLNPTLHHERVFPEDGEPHIFYAAYQTVDGGEHFVVWWKSRVILHAKKHSQAYNKAGSPWQKNFDAMAKKTVLIDVLRYGPKSIELQEAIQFDNVAMKIDEKATMDAGELVIVPSYQDEEDRSSSLDALVADANAKLEESAREQTTSTI